MDRQPQVSEIAEQTEADCQKPKLHLSALLGCCTSEYDYEAEPHLSDVEKNCEGQYQEPPHFHCSALLGCCSEAPASLIPNVLNLICGVTSALTLCTVEPSL